MRIFSKIPAFFLALVISFSSFSQVQNSSSEFAFQYSEGDGISAYIDISSGFMWGLINPDNSSTLLFAPSYTGPKEDKKNGSQANLAQESALERFSSIFLLLTRNTESGPTIRELLYPSHFYF